MYIWTDSFNSYSFLYSLKSVIILLMLYYSKFFVHIDIIIERIKILGCLSVGLYF